MNKNARGLCLAAAMAFMSFTLSGCACSTDSVPGEPMLAEEQHADGEAEPVENADEAADVTAGSEAVPSISASAAPAPNPQAGGQESGAGKADSGTSSASGGAPAHAHSWTPKIVHHDAVYEQQWVDNWVWIERYKCKTCGTLTYSIAEANGHQKASGRGGCGAYVSDEYQENRGSYEQVCIQEAYDETVGYACSCGAVK